MKTPFIWLGSGRAKKRGTAAKGLLLDSAAKAGLPVPPGAILLDELFELLLVEGVVVAENGRITIPDPNWLHETIYKGVRFPRLDGPVVVRAGSGATATAQTNVDFSDPRQLSDSLCELWQQFDNERRDVLVMEMVQRDVGGTAVTATTTHQDNIYIPNQPSHTLPQLGRWQRPDSELPPHLQRLQRLLRGVRRTFGSGTWQIDWLDDGRICWLLQIQSQL
jgi:hypothetical protein